MLIVNNELKISYHPILNYLPGRIKRILTFTRINDAEEIRLRNGLPLVIHFSDDFNFITDSGVLTKNSRNAIIVSDSEMNEALELIVKSSLYTAENSLKQAYVTIDGGNRIGICGSAVIYDNKISSIKTVSGLNYRLAKEICGCADVLIKDIYKDGIVSNTLIISPPCCGKTTVLRDIARNLSYRGLKVAVADERNEICALSDGKCGFDLGYSIDVLENAPKAEAINLLIRSMSPDVIITDELGTLEDYIAIEKAIYSGVSIIASVHSASRKSFSEKNFEFSRLFNCFVTLNRKNGPGTIGEIYCD